MKILLHDNVGQATINRIGDYLRRHRTGHYWFERYRGRIFIIVADAGDEAILRTRFTELLEEVGERMPKTSETGDPANDLDPTSNSGTSASSSRKAPVRRRRQEP